MSTTAPKLPGPDHLITIAPHEGHVVVRAGDRIVADSTRALALHEGDYPAVYYLPLSDLDRAALRDSETTTFCPYKGTASYYSVDTGDAVVADAVWYYPDAFPAVAQITDHAAFYPDRVDIEVD